MGCLCSKPQQMTKEPPLLDSEFPKYDKVWRSYDYRIGYKCTICGEPAKCYDHVSLNCQPSEYRVKENQWHRHCAHNIKVPVVCSIGHATMQLLNTGCECGWRNQNEFTDDSSDDDSTEFRSYRVPSV